MVLAVRPSTQGRVTVITGPVGSEKTDLIEAYLDTLVDSGYRRDSNVLVFRHPRDDQNPERIGRHQAQVMEQVPTIVECITPNTSTVIIAGASHFSDPSLVDFVDALVRSERQVLLSGLNLDSQGNPYGLMPDLITLATDVILAKGICSDINCQSTDANRSTHSTSSEEEYVPVCSHHAAYPDSPPPAAGATGSLQGYAGPMFASKSTKWKRDLQKAKTAGRDPLVFKWLDDTRYGEEKKKVFDLGNVTLHTEMCIPAILVQTAQDIQQYLANHKRQRDVFIDEAGFISGMYDLVISHLPKGYHFTINALLRSFNRQRLGEAAALVALADRVDIGYAACVQCFEPATESQRYTIEDGKDRGDGQKVPAPFDDLLVRVGGGARDQRKHHYEARCLRDLEVPGMPALRYQLPPFSWDNDGK